MRSRISGKEADRVAKEAAERGPIPLRVPPDGVSAATNVPVPLDGPQSAAGKRKLPPRVRKPSPHHDQCQAPTADLAGHRARLREAFGDTMSDEFVDVMLGKLVEAMRPNPSDQLDEPTLNAGLAIINSMQPRSEFEALMTVQIVATAFSGMRFLRQSHRHMTEDFIDVYGGYAIKLLRLQADLIRAFDRHRRGNRQTVEVRHVHLHPGSQGVVGIVNQPHGEGQERK
jgi:hypothetical protein